MTWLGKDGKLQQKISKLNFVNVLNKGFRYLFDDDGEMWDLM